MLSKAQILNIARLKIRTMDPYLAWALVIAFIGLILRVYHVSLLYYTPTGDQQVYPSYGDLLIRRLTVGDLNEMDRWLLSRNPPGYSYIVGTIRYLFGVESLKTVYYLQALVDSVTSVMYFFIGRKLVSSPVGFISTVTYAAYSMALLYTAQMQTETFTVALCVLAVLVILKAYETMKLRYFIMAGLVCGTAMLFRLNTFTIPLVAGAAGLYRLLRTPDFLEKKRLFVRLCVYTFITILVILPISIINSRTAGKLVIVNGSNGERLMLGANPNTRGAYNFDEPIPPAWWSQVEKAPLKERDSIAQKIVNDFIFETHPAYFWFTIFPNKFWGLLWANHWVYVGQHSGNSMEYPFGPYLRIPLITSGFLVMLGLLGLLYRTKIISRYLLWNVIVQFMSIQALIIEARYRLVTETFLIVPFATLLYQAFFREETQLRLKRVLVFWAAFSFVWSALNVIRFGGANLLLAAPSEKSEPMDKMVQSQFVFEKQSEEQESIPLGRVPVDAGKCSHIAVSFSYKLERPEAKKDSTDITTAWPRLLMTLNQYDDTMTTISTDLQVQNAPDLSAFQTDGGSQFRVVELLGKTKFIRLQMNLQNSGTVTISQLKARGPVWYEIKPQN